MHVTGFIHSATATVAGLGQMTRTSWWEWSCMVTTTMTRTRRGKALTVALMVCGPTARGQPETLLLLTLSMYSLNGMTVIKFVSRLSAVYKLTMMKYLLHVTDLNKVLFNSKLSMKWMKSIQATLSINSAALQTFCFHVPLKFIAVVYFNRQFVISEAI